MAGQRRLDLPRLDAEAAQLHLVVGAAEELDLAVGREARQVARPIEPLAGSAQRMGDEALRRQAGPAEVAAREARPADVELAGHPQRHRLELRIEQPDPQVRDRAADGDRAPCGARQRPVRRHVDRRLGGTVEVVQLMFRQARARLPAARGNAPRARPAAPRRSPSPAGASGSGRGRAARGRPAASTARSGASSPPAPRSAASGRPDRAGRPAAPAPAARRRRAARTAPRPTRRRRRGSSAARGLRA